MHADLAGAAVTTRGRFDQLLFETTVLRAERYQPKPKPEIVWAVQAEVAFTLEDGYPVAEGDVLVWKDNRWQVMDAGRFGAQYERVPGGTGEHE